MEKLEAVQKVLRFSDATREWVTGEHSIYFDDGRLTFREINMKPHDVEPFAVKLREH